MTELTDLSPTDASNTSITGQSLLGNTANMANMDDTLQAMLGMLGRWTSSDTIASAATTDIGAQPEAYLTVSGTTTITAFGTVRTGTVRFLRFPGALTLTHNATSLILPGAANITTASGDTAVFVSEGSGNWRCISYSRASGEALVAPFKGHIYGLTLSNNVTDATNDIDIAVGEAASDATTPALLALASALTKRLDAAWAVGTGNGGLDTGAIANTTYHVWLIQRSDTGVVDALFSTSATAPTMPTNYDRKRRIGAIIRAAGVIRPFHQLGDRFWLKTPTQDASTTLTTSAATISLSVPSGIELVADVNASLRGDGQTYDFLMRVFSTSDIDATVAVSNASLVVEGILSVTFGYSRGTFQIKTNTSGQILVRSNASTGTYIISTRGWIDPRGQTA